MYVATGRRGLRRSERQADWPRVRARDHQCAARRARLDLAGAERGHRRAGPLRGGARGGRGRGGAGRRGSRAPALHRAAQGGAGAARRVPAAAARQPEALPVDRARRGAPRRRALHAQGRRAAPAAGRARRSVPRDRHAAGRGDPAAAVAAVRDPRRQPGLERLLPRRHARAAAVSLPGGRRRGARPAGRKAGLLSGRVRRLVRPLRGRHHRRRDAAGAQRRLPRRSRAAALRRLAARRGQAAEQRARRGLGPLRVPVVHHPRHRRSRLARVRRLPAAARLARAHRRGARLVRLAHAQQPIDQPGHHPQRAGQLPARVPPRAGARARSHRAPRARGGGGRRHRRDVDLRRHRRAQAVARLALQPALEVEVVPPVRRH